MTGHTSFFKNEKIFILKPYHIEKIMSRKLKNILKNIIIGI